jgi:hypothetical protein
MMKIMISVSGTYCDGSWVPTEIKASDDQDQTYSINKNTDGTYCVESHLIGDETTEFSGSLSFEQAWMGLAHAFGVIEQ